MNAFWSRLSLRERWLLAGTGCIVLAAALYALAWAPLAAANAARRHRIQALQADLAWMQQMAPRLQQAGARTSPVEDGNAQAPLPSRLETSLQRAGLGAGVRSIEASSDARVTIAFESVAFDALIGWLEALQREQGITVGQAVLERLPTPGQVRARLEFGGG